MSMQNCWELSKKWFSGRADLEWEHFKVAEMQELFRGLGLTGDFWKITEWAGES